MRFGGKQDTWGNIIVHRNGVGVESVWGRYGWHIMWAFMMCMGMMEFMWVDTVHVVWWSSWIINYGTGMELVANVMGCHGNQQLQCEWWCLHIWSILPLGSDHLVLPPNQSPKVYTKSWTAYIHPWAVRDIRPKWKSIMRKWTYLADNMSYIARCPWSHL